MNSGDAVALAVDNPKPGKSRSVAASYYTCFPIAQPLSDLFYRNAIASGSIVPPSGEGASVRRTDYLMGLLIIAFLFALAFGAFAFAAMWRP